MRHRHRLQSGPQTVHKRTKLFGRTGIHCVCKSRFNDSRIESLQEGLDTRGSGNFWPVTWKVTTSIYAVAERPAHSAVQLKDSLWHGAS